jgi:hypothetical protein
MDGGQLWPECPPGWVGETLETRLADPRSTERLELEAHRGLRLQVSYIICRIRGAARLGKTSDNLATRLRNLLLRTRGELRLRIYPQHIG